MKQLCIRHGAFRHSWRVRGPCPVAEQSQCLLLRDPHPSWEIPCRPFPDHFFSILSSLIFSDLYPKLPPNGRVSTLQNLKKNKRSRPQNAPTVKTCTNKHKHIACLTHSFMIVFFFSSNFYFLLHCGHDFATSKMQLGLIICYVCSMSCILQKHRKIKKFFHFLKAFRTDFSSYLVEAQNS